MPRHAEARSEGRSGGPDDGPQCSPNHQLEVGMTRTGVMASSRPRIAAATFMGSGSARLRRGLPAIAVLLLTFALVLPGSALATEGSTGYSQTPTTPPPTTTPTPGATSPSTGT